MSFSRFARNQVAEAPGRRSLQDLGAQYPLGGGYPGFGGVFVFVDPFFRLFSGGPLQQVPATWDAHVNLSTSRRKHLLQFGADFARDRVISRGAGFLAGQFFFNGQRSGHAFADLLLGLPSQVVQDNGVAADIREVRFGFYVQDDWRITRRLTLNLGLRWDPWLPAVDANENLTAFVPGRQSTVAPNAPRGLLYGGDEGIPDSILSRDWNNFAPRVGFAWDVQGNARTIIRSAYGLYYNDRTYSMYQAVTTTQPGVVRIATLNPPAFANPYPAGSPFPRPRVDRDDYGTYQFARPVAATSFDPSARTGYTQSWNLTIERQVTERLAASVAYVGNLNLKGLIDRNINPAIFGPGATLQNIEARRRYPGLGAVNWLNAYGTSNYHALQITANTRMARGLTLAANYTWGKAIDNISVATNTGGNASPRNPFNVALDRAASDFDVTHRVNVSFVYDVPKLAADSAWQRHIANDWQVNGIFTAQTGTPFSVTSGTDRSLSGIGRDTADLVGDPARPNGADPLQRYFNTAAFAPAALGTFGNSGRNILRGPGRMVMDLSIFKNFRLTEAIRLQFRAESFNIQNRANFQNPNANVAAGANFGRILGADDPRVFQFGLKLQF